MSEIADAMRQMLHSRGADLDAEIVDALQSHRDAVAGFDKELAQFQGRDLGPEDVAKLQVIINKRNEAFEMISQLLKKQQQAFNSIINKMR